jgi:hypothetical protein
MGGAVFAARPVVPAPPAAIAATLAPAALVRREGHQDHSTARLVWWWTGSGLADGACRTSLSTASGAACAADPPSPFRCGIVPGKFLLQLDDRAEECAVMTSPTVEIVDRLDRLAGRRGPGRARPARGRDLLLKLADQAPAPAPAEAARILHGVLAAVKRRAISEAFAVRLLDKMLPDAKAARPRATVALALPEVVDAASFAAAQAEVLRAVAAGELAPAEAKRVSDVLTRTWEARCVAMRSGTLADWSTRPG